MRGGSTLPMSPPANGLRSFHPGDILRDDFLVPMKISVYTLAQAIKVPRSRVNDIVLGRRGITTDTTFDLKPEIAACLSVPERIRAMLD
jgi:addiction module HigA family antidote